MTVPPHIPELREWITGHRCLCGAGPFARLQELQKHADFERAERESRRQAQQSRWKVQRRQTVPYNPGGAAPCGAS